eukprot:232838-Pleurochrysis_carterae.AAC.1
MSAGFNGAVLRVQTPKRAPSIRPAQLLLTPPLPFLEMLLTQAGVEAGKGSRRLRCPRTASEATLTARTRARWQ